ncbi:MAG: hypothetical protein QXG05_07175 [Nitrososphaerota archaeon]
MSSKQTFKSKTSIVNIFKGVAGCCLLHIAWGWQAIFLPDKTIQKYIQEQEEHSSTG